VIGTPESVHRVRIPDEEKPRLMVDDLAGLVSLVQIGILEIHPWAPRVNRIERPDWVIFDLDPGPDVPWLRVIETAQRIRDMLRNVWLVSFVKCQRALETSQRGEMPMRAIRNSTLMCGRSTPATPPACRRMCRRGHAHQPRGADGAVRAGGPGKHELPHATVQLWIEVRWLPECVWQVITVRLPEQIHDRFARG
jgi:hypothetical protein